MKHTKKEVDKDGALRAKIYMDDVVQDLRDAKQAVKVGNSARAKDL